MDKILLAEDYFNLGTLLQEFLEQKGFHVTWAQDGEQAWNYFVAGQFDICVFDVMMPKKDGFTLAKEVRLSGKDIPIIFLTAKSFKEDTLQGFK